jgi:type IV fimbrial biogenesis protein FimT
MCMKKNSGFTLLELMITVGIIGVVTAIAVPSMGVYIKNDRLTTNINTLVGHLAYARNEAVTRSVQVGLCASENTTSCSGNNWSLGWILFVDEDANNTFTPGEEITRVKQALHSSNTMTYSNGDGAVVIYDNRGFTPNSSGSFSLCDDRTTANLKSISISVTGRVRKGGATAC